MTDTASFTIDDDDGIDRRGFLRCMAWAGTGMAWIAGSGVLKSAPLPRLGQAADRRLATGDFVFAQISDSHIGFSKDANKDVVSTLQAAIGRIQALPVAPDFLIHTGDLTHLSKPEEFDTLQQVLIVGEGRPGVLRAGRARHARRRRPAVPGSVRQGHAGPGLVQLRPQGRALHRARQRGGSQGRRPRQSRRRATGVARTGPEGPRLEHTDRRLRAHSAVVGLSRMGMGDRRRRAGVGVSQASSDR